MRNVYQEITKEKFAELDAMDRPTFNKYINNNIPVEWACGYGHYGAWLKYDQEEDKYYIIHNLGDSCD